MSVFDMINDLKSLKKDQEWLNEINSQSLQQIFMKLQTSFRSFFRRNTSYPDFRSKKGNKYFIVSQHFSFDQQGMHFPKFKRAIKFRDKPTVPESIKHIIITRGVDLHYASVQYESEEEPPKGTGIVGIEIGMAHFITTSDGLQVELHNDLR